MALFKSAFITTTVAVATCLSLLMGVLFYLQQAIFQHNINAQQQTATILVSSLGETPSLSSQLAKKMAQLPGWQAAIYNAEGQLQWQSGETGLKTINIKDVIPGRVAINLWSEQEWASHYFLLKDHASPGQRVIVVSQSLAPVEETVQSVINLVLGAALIIGLVLWFAIRQNTRSLKAEIRGYIRHYRKELTQDRLTGLPNREIFLDRIQHALARAKRNQGHVAVLYLGLDRFGEVNERYGPAAGDRVLCTIASRLSAASRASDTLVRIEGDEFALLLTDVHKLENIEQICNRVVSVFRLPVELGGKEHVVSASIGIAMNEQEDVDSEALLLNAYAVMKEVKSQGGGNIYQFYVKDLQSGQEIETARESELYRALDNEEFRLYYQPKIDVESGVIKGVEAILRWQHPHRGLVSPLEFIPFLEESGLIVTVGEWVLREACRVNKAWQDEGLSPIKISVNVSSVQLRQPGFVELVDEILESSGLAAAHLELEMTESSLMRDRDGIIPLLDDLKKRGVSLSLDHFGTGYSSLSLLKRVPVDVLKIDRTFITDLHKRDGSDNADIVMAIMALSHSLKLEVVAEGVETRQEMEYLDALGCGTFQGFLYSQPVSENEFRTLLQRSLSLDEVLSSLQPALNQ